jgi:hypothetical protein
MADRTIQLSLAPLAGAGAAQIGSLRLLASPDGALLVTSTTGPAPRAGCVTTYASSRFASPASTSTLAAVLQILPVPPGWDVAGDSGGGCSLVYEVAGGAMNALFLKHLPGGGEATCLSAHHPLESFGKPRFFKGQPASVSAIAEGRRLVALSTTAAAYTPLVEAEDGLVVRSEKGYVLFYKTARPGPVRGSDIFRGVLRCVRLGDDLRPEGPVLAPFGDTTVFELDADMRGADLVVVATTEAGLSLSLLQVEADGIAVVAQRSVPHEAELLQPAIVAAGSELHVAVLQAGTTERERVWTGRVTVEIPS